MANETFSDPSIQPDLDNAGPEINPHTSLPPTSVVPRAPLGNPPPHPPMIPNNSSTFSLDPFDSHDPHLWFQITEMTCPPHMTSYEKSVAVVRALPKTITVQIRNELGTLSAALDPYSDLKAAIYKSIDPHPDEQIK